MRTTLNGYNQELSHELNILATRTKTVKRELDELVGQKKNVYQFLLELGCLLNLLNIRLEFHGQPNPSLLLTMEVACFQPIKLIATSSSWMLVDNKLKRLNESGLAQNFETSENTVTALKYSLKNVRQFQFEEIRSHLFCITVKIYTVCCLVCIEATRIEVNLFCQCDIDKFQPANP